ncbi:acyltransferase [candidate division KSB1 bacterium]
MISSIYKRKLLPRWLMQFGSDILLFFAQNMPHPKLRILVCKMRGSNLKGVKYIGMNCLIGNHPWLLTMKKNVVVSSGTRILTEDASYQNVDGERFSAEVVIEENVHIGMNCVILPGVTVGRNSIIGAGSVVMQSIPSDSVALGNPARVVMSVEMGKMMLKKKLKNMKKQDNV